MPTTASLVALLSIRSPRSVCSFFNQLCRERCEGSKGRQGPAVDLCLRTATLTCSYAHYVLLVDLGSIFILSSSPQASMANPKSSILYSRTKGLTEQALAELGYKDTIIFRPGALSNTQRSDSRVAESAFLYALLFRSPHRLRSRKASSAHYLSDLGRLPA